MPSFTALEKQAEIRDAIATWKAKFAENSQPLRITRGVAHWQERLGIWGFFGQSTSRPSGLPRPWNPFGLIPERFRENITVELNPPRKGPSTNVHGVIALDANGHRWILHKGAMAASAGYITNAKFEAVTSLRQETVSFGNGSSFNFYPVADLDASATSLQDGIAAYVLECHRIRTLYREGMSFAARQRPILDAEKGFNIENTEEYDIGAHVGGTAMKRHAHVVNNLAALFDELNVKYSNERIGRYGPDIHTTEGRRVLFEVKSDYGPTSVYGGIGQLFVYERLLEEPYQKVLVLPNRPNADLQAAIDSLKIDCLIFVQKGTRGQVVEFDRAAVMDLLGLAVST